MHLRCYSDLRKYHYSRIYKTCCFDVPSFPSRGDRTTERRNNKCNALHVELLNDLLALLESPPGILLGRNVDSSPFHPY